MITSLKFFLMYPPPLLLVYLIKSKFTRKNSKRYHFYVKTGKKTAKKLTRASKKIDKYCFISMQKKAKIHDISNKSQK
ncbi:hypothetical protein CYK55_07615 [Enterococcus mundtii]|nr:hypothetical protein CYK55_07615 [Enterococcus mundtii]